MSKKQYNLSTIMDIMTSHEKSQPSLIEKVKYTDASVQTSELFGESSKDRKAKVRFVDCKEDRKSVV